MKRESSNAEIAQLVEHNLAKVRVASSSLVFRSELKRVFRVKPGYSFFVYFSLPRISMYFLCLLSDYSVYRKRNFNKT